MTPRTPDAPYPPDPDLPDPDLPDPDLPDPDLPDPDLPDPDLPDSSLDTATLTDDDIYVLIEYVTGTLPPVEARAVEARCAVDGAYARTLARTRATWSIPVPWDRAPSNLTETERALQRFFASDGRLLASPAVSPTVALTAQPSPVAVRPAAEFSPPTPARRTFTRRQFVGVVTATAGVTALVTAGIVGTTPAISSAVAALFASVTTARSTTTYAEHHAPPGQTASFTLRDGTRVELAGGSRLRYAVPFAAAEANAAVNASPNATSAERRDVWIEGRAYIVVPDIGGASDAFTEPLDTIRARLHHVPPFVVHAGPATITIPAGPGSAFEIGYESGAARPTDDATLTVRADRGDLTLIADTARATADARAVLWAGSTAIARHGTITVTPTGIRGTVSWRGVGLSFVNVPAADVIHELNRWYALPMRLRDPAADGDRGISLTIDTTPPEEIPSRVAEALGVQVVREGDAYVLGGRRASTTVR